MGGSRLKAMGRCVFAMRVTTKITFNEYWSDPDYLGKRPVRNGSRKMLVGDNIYYYDFISKEWKQADSHHSNPDGTVNLENLKRDTKTDRVLISDHFFYFGNQAPVVPTKIIKEIGFTNGIGYRVFDGRRCDQFIRWLEVSHGKSLNVVTAPPFEFDKSEKRYSGKGSKIL
jgi:hypothetical protein